jgi:hypothetical protein
MLPVVAAQRIAGTIAANNAAQTNNVIRFRCTYPV